LSEFYVSTPNPNHALLSEVLSGYRDEYKELADIWKQLDSKAQGVITVCGVFLAGVFAFARGITDPAETWQKILLTAATILLVLSVIVALRALRVREVELPPYGDEHHSLLTDLLRDGAPIDGETADAYLRDQIRMWAKCNKSVYDANGTKADWTQTAQNILVGAIVCASLVTGLAIW
jgi:hypothetical protein